MGGSMYSAGKTSCPFTTTQQSKPADDFFWEIGALYRKSSSCPWVALMDKYYSFCQPRAEMAHISVACGWTTEN